MTDTDRLRAAVAKRKRRRVKNVEIAAKGAIGMTSTVPSSGRIILPRELPTDLQPWQRDIAERFMGGRRVVLLTPRRPR